MNVGILERVIRSVSFCAAEHHTLPRLAIHIIKIFFFFVPLNHFAFSNVHCEPMFSRQLPKKKTRTQVG